MKDIINNKKMLYVGIAILVIGIAFAIGTYAYYSITITGTATGQVLAYTCTGNNTTNFTLDPFTNAYPGYSATRTISLNASIYTEATINVSSYKNMGESGQAHENLAIYSDESHTKKMSNGVNTITTTITPGTATDVPIYIYWPYDGTDAYSTSVPSATITITCNQGANPDEVAAAKFEAGKTCVAVTSASDLHTETCSQTSGYCAADNLGSTITYGTIYNSTEGLKTGNAFDCDINNNKVIDRDANGNSTERFYYVSDYYNQNIDGTDMTSAAFDTATAVLVYYQNYQNGSASNSGVTYNSIYNNYSGPVTAVTHLPLAGNGTSNTWRSDLLKTTTRAILACDFNCTTISTSTSGNTLPGGDASHPAFSYSGKAARLLTLQEVVKGCKSINIDTSLLTNGSLAACNFLLEKTKYANASDYSIEGMWLENPPVQYTSILYVVANSRNVGNIGSNYPYNGVRPTIDVAKTKLGF